VLQEHIFFDRKGERRPTHCLGQMERAHQQGQFSWSTSFSTVRERGGRLTASARAVFSPLSG